MGRIEKQCVKSERQSMGQTEADLKYGLTDRIKTVRYSVLFSRSIVFCIERQKVIVFNGFPVLGWATWLVQSTHQFEL